MDLISSTDDNKIWAHMFPDQPLPGTGATLAPIFLNSHCQQGLLLNWSTYVLLCELSAIGRSVFVFSCLALLGPVLVINEILIIISFSIFL